MARGKTTTIICLLALLVPWTVAADDVWDNADEEPWSDADDWVEEWPEEVKEDHSFHFRTERNITGQYIDVKSITTERADLAPGYLFFAPVTWLQGWGPQIYDIDGGLIWDGIDASGHIAQQFYACDYHGSKAQHLCWHEASALGLHRKGSNITVHDYQRIFDNSYTQVDQNYTTTGKITTGKVDIETAEEVDEPATPDSHEFYVVDNGKSYLQTVYARLRWDLTPWGGGEDGWLLDSCMQDIELGTERVLFRWCYSENAEIETHVYPHTEGQTNFSTQFAGSGSWFEAWDFFHLNSADKNEEGDYLVSGRHNDQLIKIAGPGSPNGKPGEILWRLGGDSNDFEYETDFTFSRQHHARFVGTYNEWTFMTIFDNAWEGDGDEDSQSASYSSGKLLSVNNVTMKAKLLQEYPHPEGELSRSGGSMQMLPNKNMFVGWGFIRQVTEFKYDGTVVYHAHLANAGADAEFSSNYRNYKYPWVGMPAAPPKVIAYTHSCETDDAAPLLAYVSWNGATEVARWRFRTSDFPTGPWIHRTTVDKVGFETSARVSNRFYPYVKVEALNAKGKVIRSVMTPTFVPNDVARNGCDLEGCDDEKFANYDPTFSIADTCERHYSFPIIGLVLTVVFIELCSWFVTLIVGLQRLRKTMPGDLGVYAMLDTKQNGVLKGEVALSA